MKIPDGWISIPIIKNKGLTISIEQRTLVKCEHCKWFDYTNCLRTNAFDYRLCKLHDAYMKEGDFCCYGQEKTDC